MEDPKHLKSKEDLQLERMLFFSDGVFAIAITIMIFEIKVPDDIQFTDSALWQYLWKTSMKFFGFFLSFTVVGHYTVVHHKIFGYVKKCTNKLLWINLAFLLSVVLLPFSSGLLGKYSSELDMKLPYVIYVANLCFTGAINCWIWKVVNDPRKHLLTHVISPARIKLGIYRSLILPLVFIISLAVSFVMPFLSRFIPLGIPLIIHYGMKGLERNANKSEVHHHHHQS
ncbi:MAG: TMEM175 family protein [Bacteroidota bacterium]